MPGYWRRTRRPVRTALVRRSAVELARILLRRPPPKQRPYKQDIAGAFVIQNGGGDPQPLCIVDAAR